MLTSREEELTLLGAKDTKKRAGQLLTTEPSTQALPLPFLLEFSLCFTALNFLESVSSMHARIEGLGM